MFYHARSAAWCMVYGNYLVQRVANEWNTFMGSERCSITYFEVITFSHFSDSGGIMFLVERVETKEG